jgi:hypothetical protein
MRPSGSTMRSVSLIQRGRRPPRPRNFIRAVVAAMFVAKTTTRPISLTADRRYEPGEPSTSGTPGS